MMRKITLTKGKIALIDDDDFERVNQHSWCAAKTTYGKWRAETRIKSKLIRLHRFITGAKPGEVVHHIDGNPLNDKKENLQTISSGHHAAIEYQLGNRIIPNTKKLTIKDVRLIRYIKKLGCFNGLLAFTFGVTPSMISNIAHNRSWKYI